MGENHSSDTPFLVGEDNFQNFNFFKGIYVDKTEIIYQMLTGSMSFVPYFLARPRRFGKTLLLDTISNIFAGKRELFSGLKIEKKLGDRWDTFPVIRLSMNSTYPKPEMFEQSLLGHVKTMARSLGIVLNDSDPSNAIASFIIQMSIDHKPTLRPDESKLALPDSQRNVVLLIDEYDFPLISNIGGPRDNLEAIRLTLRSFYASIKSCSRFLRFVFITSITKFKQLSVFSGMNTTRDISLETAYAAICGFTQKEIIETFKDYLQPTLDYLKSKGNMDPGSTPTDLIKRLMDWYNGYTWDGDLFVLNPHSVLPVYSNVGIWLSAQRWKGLAKPQSWYLLAIICYYSMEEDSDI